MLIGVFLLAAVLMTLALRFFDTRAVQPDRPRPEGVAFVGAVLGAALCGWAWFSWAHGNDEVSRTISAMGKAVTTSSRRIVPFDVVWLWLLCFGVYFLSALRGLLKWPVWLADALLVAAAYLAVRIAPETLISIVRRFGSGEVQYVALGAWAIPLTIVWMWAVARMTASLNRVPQAVGGYLGFVALAILLISYFQARSEALFPAISSAALAGAGLATVPFALKRPGFNLSWSATLAMGFLLALIGAIGLLKNTLFAILVLSLLAFGLPLLDVSFYRVSAALRGQRVEWDETHLRLHQALLRRGLSPVKIALLYLAIIATLCALGVLAARLLFVAPLSIWSFALRLIFVVILAFGAFIVFFSLTRILMRRGEDEEIPTDVEAFGVRVSPVSMREAMDKIEGFIRSGQPHHVVTSDANAILRAQEDPEYAAILRRAALITPDGFGVIWGARLMNLPVYERVTGVDMVTGICERAAKNNYSIYILGSAPGIAATAAQKLSERYPGMRVAGTQHGFFKPDEEPAVIQRIHDAKPDVLFVAFGIPKQEKFIAKHFDAMRVPVCLGVGGSFDVYSEKLKRAPEYIQRSGLEWLYRVWQEPWRWKRMSYVPRFMAFALREWMFGHRARQNKSKKPAAPDEAEQP